MTYSFQVIVNTDEDMGVVLSALFGGLITVGKERNELKKQLEELHQNRKAALTAPLSVDTAKQLLKAQGYDVYMRKNKKNKSKEKK